MPDILEIHPVAGPVQGTVRPPGSKSLTNRALVVAALADGHSRLTGVLDSQDTQVMLDSLRRLRVDVRHDPVACTVDIDGCAGRPPDGHADLWLENSGTSIRFLTAMTTLGRGRIRLDGNTRMRKRPIADLVEALHGLGANVHCESDTGCPPVVVEANGLPGGMTRVAGSVSSQFLSGLLMASPCARGPIELEVEGEMVSQPYIDMTLGVMAKFGVVVDTATPGRYRIAPHVYRAGQYDVEPDASAASYFFAVAAITGGSVTVSGLSQYALQGDVAFVDALEQMGCKVTRKTTGITVEGRPLKGIDIDMNAISDTAQTLAAVAVFAAGPTIIRNVAHMRLKETDRLTALATELERLGQTVVMRDDELEVHPAPISPATISTYDDHRMAMSFALIGLRSSGIRIADPGCCAKTYPHFFDDLEILCAPHR